MDRKTSALISAALAVQAMLGCGLPGHKLDLGSATPPGTPRYVMQPIDAPALQRLSARVPKPRPNRQLERLVRSYEYRVGPQDSLVFTVWDHPELGTSSSEEACGPGGPGHVVGHDGSIFFPYVGTLPVAGRTLSELRVMMTRRLSAFIQDPQVEVRVGSFRSQRVSVTGAVANPGVLPITDVPMTLLEALNLAGGETADALLSRVRVMRGDAVRHFDLWALLSHGDLDQNLLLRHGDVVYVPHADGEVVHVIGEVEEQSAVPLSHGRLTLAGALTASGGMDQGTAALERVFVIRPSMQSHLEATVYWLDLRSPASMLLATHFAMQPQDVVFVAARPIARWNQLIMQILPTVQTLWQTQSLIRQY